MNCAITLVHANDFAKIKVITSGPTRTELLTVLMNKKGQLKFSIQKTIVSGISLPGTQLLSQEFTWPVFKPAM